MPSILNYIPQVLIISGICAFSPIFSKLHKGFGSFLFYFGVFIGAVSLIQSILMLLEKVKDLFTIFLLFLIGLMLVFRPIKSFKWAALLALMLGVFIAYLFKIFFPALSLIVSLIVFGFVTIVSYLILKFLEDLFNLLIKILSFPPVAIILGFFSFFQGIFLMFNKNLIELIVKLVQLSFQV